MPTDRGDRAYLLTINNWSQEEYDTIKALKYKYLVIGKEIAPTTGTPHIHAYVYLKDAKTFSSMKKKFPRANIKLCDGSPQQNRTYCIKDKEYEEFGTIPEQGKRTDIERIRDQVNQGLGLEEIVETATSYQSIRTAEVLLKYKEKKRNFKPLVKWYYGSTGTGKTRTAYEENEGKRIYTAMDTAKWFDGYDAHEVLIIDDMRRDFIKFHNLLKLLDRYEFRVETKGGTRQMLAKTIIITSPHSPEQLWSNHEEDIQQLLRRIDEVREFT